jgi:hypothetical protein
MNGARRLPPLRGPKVSRSVASSACVDGEMTVLAEHNEIIDALLAARPVGSMMDVKPPGSVAGLASALGTPERPASLLGPLRRCEVIGVRHRLELILARRTGRAVPIQVRVPYLVLYPQRQRPRMPT